MFDLNWGSNPEDIQGISIGDSVIMTSPDWKQRYHPESDTIIDLGERARVVDLLPPHKLRAEWNNGLVTDVLIQNVDRL